MGGEGVDERVGPAKRRVDPDLRLPLGELSQDTVVTAWKYLGDKAPTSLL